MSASMSATKTQKTKTATTVQINALKHAENEAVIGEETEVAPANPPAPPKKIASPMAPARQIDVQAESAGESDDVVISGQGRSARSRSPAKTPAQNAPGKLDEQDRLKEKTQKADKKNKKGSGTQSGRGRAKSRNPGAARNGTQCTRGEETS